MSSYMAHEHPPEHPERSLAETENLHAPSLDDLATMHRTVSWLRKRNYELGLQDEQQEGLELLGGLVETALKSAVPREPELAASMADTFSASPSPVDRGLACDLLSQYHRQLIVQDAVNDADREVGRWRRLVDNAIPGHERDWFQAAAGFVIEHVADMDISDRSRAFVDALRTVAAEE